MPNLTGLFGISSTTARWEKDANNVALFVSFFNWFFAFYLTDLFLIKG